MNKHKRMGSGKTAALQTTDRLITDQRQKKNSLNLIFDESISNASSEKTLIPTTSQNKMTQRVVISTRLYAAYWKVSTHPKGVAQLRLSLRLWKDTAEVMVKRSLYHLQQYLLNGKLYCCSR